MKKIDLISSTPGGHMWLQSASFTKTVFGQGNSQGISWREHFVGDEPAGSKSSSQLFLPGGNPAGHAEKDAADMKSKGSSRGILESEGVQQ